MSNNLNIVNYGVYGYLNIDVIKSDLINLCNQTASFVNVEKVWQNAEQGFNAFFDRLN